jgi:hypothetical protein
MEVRFDYRRWMELAQDRVNWLAWVLAMLNLRARLSHC